MADLRTIEAASIRAFIQSAAEDGYLSGRVLDYGCGKQPYRDIVEAAGGEYHGFDRASFPGSVTEVDYGFSNTLEQDKSDAILCTQILQFVPDVDYLLDRFWSALREGGHLVLTWAICWPLVEEEDLHRFTVSGMKRLLTEAGFEILRCEVRAEYNDFPIGGQAIARA